MNASRRWVSVERTGRDALCGDRDDGEREVRRPSAWLVECVQSAYLDTSTQMANTELRIWNRDGLWYDAAEGDKG